MLEKQTAREMKKKLYYNSKFSGTTNFLMTKQNKKRRKNATLIKQIQTLGSDLTARVGVGEKVKQDFYFVA